MFVRHTETNNEQVILKLRVDLEMCGLDTPFAKITQGYSTTEIGCKLMSKLLEIFKTMEYGPAPEAPDAVKAWLDEHGRKFGLFINNEWVTPKGAKFYSSINPSNGELLAETTQAGQKEVDAAVGCGA